MSLSVFEDFNLLATSFERECSTQADFELMLEIRVCIGSYAKISYLIGRDNRQIIIIIGD